jgi:uncharacterized membrane protein YhaH (DUF805 family)
MNWYLHLGSKNLGPISQQELITMIQRSEVGPATPVWREGMAEWVALSETELGAGNLNSLEATSEKSMIDYYVDVIKKYAVFQGRARRSEYWFFFLCNTIISCSLILVGLVTKAYWMDLVYRLAVMVPILSVAARRMHDVNKSAWWMWFPLYNIILACRAGTVGDNRFGPDPKNRFRAPTEVPKPLKKAA